MNEWKAVMQYNTKKTPQKQKQQKKNPIHLLS